MVCASAIAVIALVGLSACGGGSGSSEPTPPVVSPPPPPPERGQETRDLVATGFADVLSISLKDSGLPADLQTSALSVSSPHVLAFGIHDGFIRLATAGDAGTDQEVVIKAALKDKDVSLPVLIATSRPTEIQSETDYEDGRESSQLIVTGLGSGNTLTGGELSLRSSAPNKLSLRASSLTIVTAGQGKVLDLAPFATYDAAANAFVIKASSMQTVLEQFGSNEGRFNVGLASADGNFGEGFSFLVRRGVALVQGAVVDAAGAELTSLSGKRIAIKGFDNSIRQIASVDASGKFAFDGLGAGTYQVSLVDVARPNEWVATVAIYPGTTKATVKLVAQSGGKAVALSAGSEKGAAVLPPESFDRR